jgi:hypothetical protein
MDNINENGSRISLAWCFMLAIIEFVLVWAVASQFKYMVVELGNTSAFYIYLVIGVVVIGLLSSITIGAGAIKATESWGRERCQNLFGFRARIVYKSEVFILLIVILGTLVGTGMWDMVTVFNVLNYSGWDWSLLQQEYMVFDMIIFQIKWKLWVHIAVGSIKGGIAFLFAVFFSIKIKRGTFCETTFL